MNDHDTIVRLKEELRLAHIRGDEYKERFNHLFNYYNKKNPDEMAEYLAVLEVDAILPMPLPDAPGGE